MKEPRQISEDYISTDNIRDSFFGVGKIFVLIVDGILGMFRRYWLLFVVLITVGTGIGFLLKRAATNHAELTMLVKFNDLSRPFYAEIIGALNDLAASGSTERLATELHLKEDIAGQIGELTLEKAGKEAPGDDTSKKAPFLISVALRNITSADNIQTALLSYINDNPYLKNLTDSQTVFYRAQLTYLDSELRKLDSLKSAYNLSVNSGKTSTIYYNAFNPAEIYFRSGQIMDKKLIALEWLASEQSAMSLISAVKEEKVVRKHGTSPIIVGFIISFCLAFLIALWLDVRSKVKQQEAFQPA